MLKYGFILVLLLVLTACPAQPPAAPSITAPVGGSSTNSGTPSIAGTGVAGATVTVVEAQTTICTATVNSSNAWTCTPNKVLSNGLHTITATQIDNSSLVSPASEAITFNAKTIFTSPIANTELINENLEFKGSGVPQNTITVLENAPLSA